MMQSKREELAYVTGHGPRPQTVRCQHCQGKIKLKPRGPIPLFCSRSCRQRAYEQRKWRRPRSVELLAKDIATVRVRDVIRAEILAIMEELGLVGLEQKLLPVERRRRAPNLRLIKRPTTDDPGI